MGEIAAAPLGGDSVEALRAHVLALEAELEAHQQTVEDQAAEIRRLTEYVRLLRHHRFGRTSERAPADQLGLFNEAEALIDAEGQATDGEPLVHVPAHTRRPRGRRPLPDWLPREEVVHDLPEAEKVCPHDGSPLREIGREVLEQLEIVPAVFRVLRHVRPQYACPRCHEGVHAAPPPPQPIPKSLAGPSLLAHVAVAKYADALPLYRQAAMLERAGIDLSRATLASWMVRAGELVQPLVNLMAEEILAGDLLQCDETPFQVLREDGRPATSLSYLWVRRGGPADHPLLLYEYAPSRSKEVAKRLLEGFQGYLQTDGYEGYGEVGEAPGVLHVGCWAHARRRFHEALRGQGGAKPKGSCSSRTSRAEQGLAWIGKLYRIERSLAEASPAERQRVRQEQARPLLEKIRAWLAAALPSVPPQSLTGQALGYLERQWPKLVRYLDDGRLPIDTNAVENAIRPFALGRKNWLFADTVGGAQASANLYSVIQTAKANGLEPFAYLRHLSPCFPRRPPRGLRGAPPPPPRPRRARAPALTQQTREAAPPASVPHLGLLSGYGGPRPPGVEGVVGGGAAGPAGAGPRGTPAPGGGWQRGDLGRGGRGLAGGGRAAPLESPDRERAGPALPKKTQGEAKELLTQIPYAPTRAEAEALRDRFARRYRRWYPKAVEILEKDWERMVTFYDFPEEHWKHLRTTNVVESPFAACRLRTGAAKRFKKVASATALLWKVLLVAEKRFRRLNAPELLADVYEGRKFEDGKPVVRKERKAAA